MAAVSASMVVVSAARRRRIIQSSLVSLVSLVWLASLALRAAPAIHAQAAPAGHTQAVPGRIVSTSPSITETLFALGLGDRVVGVSTYCRYPATVARLPKIGTFLKPEVETIAGLRPDLVLVHPGPNSTASQLQTLGIKTATVDRGALRSVFTTIQQIGAAAGVSDRADRLIATLHAGLDRVHAAVSNRSSRRVLIIVGRRPGSLSDLIAVGPGSYLHAARRGYHDLVVEWRHRRSLVHLTEDGRTPCRANPCQTRRAQSRGSGGARRAAGGDREPIGVANRGFARRQPRPSMSS